MSSIEKAMQRQAAAGKEKKEPTSTIESALEKKAQDKTPQETSPIADLEINDSLASPERNDITMPLSSSEKADELERPHATDKPLPEPKELYIDLETLEGKGFVTLRNKRTLINEEYRSIKRKLLNNAFGAISRTLKHSNLILVSSSKPNEGKTFTAINLALSIALEQDKTVLLVDSDVLKPSVSKTLEIGQNVGLIEYLLGEQEDVGSIIYKTNIERLRVIPAGLPHHLSNELLSSDKMMTLIEEFATRYPDRIVVFDAPPLLGVNETAVMAEQCGQGLVVVEEHKSKLNDVKQAVELLPEEMAVGFVLNKVTTPSDSQGYGYYYGGSN